MTMLVFTFQTVSEKEKFELIFSKYKNLMLKRAYFVLNDFQLAEDAVSESCIKIYRNMHKIDDPMSNQTLAFIMMIVKNTALTMLKKRSRYTLGDIDDDQEDSFDLEGHVFSQIGIQAITQLIDGLDEEARSIFLYKYSYDMTHKEIARLLNMSENNVTVKLHRCKKRLMSMLTSEGYIYEK